MLVILLSMVSKIQKTTRGDYMSFDLSKCGNNLGELLRQYREDNNNLSYRKLAKKTGLSHAYLRKLEKNGLKPINPTTDTLTKLSIGLDIPLKKLMNICGYHDVNLKVSEPIDDDTCINLDIEFGMLIAHLTSGTPISVGDSILSDKLKTSLCEELRKTLTAIRKNYDNEE